ncbi:MAG TPA: hypothetical protein VII78_09390 [Myxococcota bacterium]
MARTPRPGSRPPAKGRSFVVRGVVEELETGRPLAELVVRAFDEDLLVDDALGYAATDATGRFAIRFDTSRFQDFREERPDLYLRLFDKDGTRLLLETRDAIRRDAKLVEEYRLRVPARALDPRRAR